MTATKSLRTLAMCIALIGLCQGYYFYAQNAIGVFPEIGADDPLCTLALWSNSTADGVQFKQNPKIPHNCTYQANFTLYSFFSGDVLNATIPFSAPVNDALYAAIDASTIKTYNGTACVLIPQQMFPEELYLCHVRFSHVHLYIEVFGTGDFDITANIPRQILTGIQNFFNRDQSFNWVLINETFPSFVVDLNNACGSNNNSITDLNTTVTVSTSVNLPTILPNVTVRFIFVKARAAVAGIYISIASTSNDTVFGSESSTNCWSLPMKYSDLLPDLNYCAGSGCEVSFVVSNSGDYVYILETNGIVTVPASSGNGGNGSTGGDGGNGGSGGVGNGGNNGGSNGGNGGGVVVSSALVMGFNALMALLLSYVYLA